MKRLSSLPVAVIASLSFAYAGLAGAGTLVVANDEWTLSDSGFSNSPAAVNFVTNLVAEFGTNIHAYSTNFGFTGSTLATTMSSAGATYTFGTGISFDLPTLSGYDAIFLGGNYLTTPQLAVLQSYAEAGGGVYIAGGTGSGGAAAEAAAWNDFLAAYGLAFAPSYNGITANIAVGGDAIFAGVDTLYQQNGQSISGSAVVCCGEVGLYAVARIDGPGPEPVPEPGTLALLGFGLAGIGFARRRKA